MALKDKAGNEIPVGETPKGVYDLIERALEGATAGMGALVQTAVADAVKTSLEDTLKPVNEKIAAIEAATKAAPPKGDGDDKTKKTGEPESDLAKTLAALTEQVTKLTSERESETKRTSAERIADEFLAKKLPNLGADAKNVMRRRIAAGLPADEAAAAKIADEVKGEWKAAGIDTAGPQFSADPKREGAKEEGGTDDAEKQAKIERIRARGALVK